MLSKLRLPLIIIVVIGLVAALGYWNIDPHSLMDEQTETTAEESIDFYASNAHIRQFQTDGTLKYDLKAPTFEHYKSSDIGHVQQPVMALYQNSDIPWNITSDKATIAPSGNSVELIDNVRFARTPTKGQTTVLTTTQLTVFPDQEYAHTEQAVRIEAVSGVTHAVGMKAYLKESRMILLSNVRGQHEVR